MVRVARWGIILDILRKNTIRHLNSDLYENHSSDCELLRLIVARSEYREGELREQRGREIEGGIRMMDRGREGWDSGAEE